MGRGREIQPVFTNARQPTHAEQSRRGHCGQHHVHESFADIHRHLRDVDGQLEPRPAVCRSAYLRIRDAESKLERVRTPRRRASVRFGGDLCEHRPQRCVLQPHPRGHVQPSRASRRVHAVPQHGREQSVRADQCWRLLAAARVRGQGSERLHRHVAWQRSCVRAGLGWRRQVLGRQQRRATRPRPHREHGRRGRRDGPGLALRPVP